MSPHLSLRIACELAELAEISELTMMDESWEVGPIRAAAAKRILAKSGDTRAGTRRRSR